MTFGAQVTVDLARSTGVAGAALAAGWAHCAACAKRRVVLGARTRAVAHARLAHAAMRGRASRSSSARGRGRCTVFMRWSSRSSSRPSPRWRAIFSRRR